MKWVCVIFTYNRPEMIAQTAAHMIGLLGYENVLVLDDGSPYNLTGCQVVQTKHGGKLNFWKQFERAFDWAEQQKADRFIFMPDDFLNFDFERAKVLDGKVPHRSVVNIINDGRQKCWGSNRPKPYKDGIIESNFCDGGFFCDVQAMEAMDYTMHPVPDRWHDRPDKSSGIGWRLTWTMRSCKIRMFTPERSLAYHGMHESVMHPEERKITPLVSR